ncbi:MAG: NTP transferase domain-containing protein [Gemmatimonadetes bacterium]|nr:NTP transferase domain-containing protein [Gemmatimonadota bacterium]
MADTRLWAVILAGGSGSRFWPVSTPRRPKQVLPLAGEAPLIRQTIERIQPLVPADRLRILTGSSLAEPVLAALPGMGRENLLLEPRARGTAPVLAWAAHEIERIDPGAIMVSLHADHVIAPEAEFRSLLDAVARVAAAQQRLFTIGAVPTRPETGYGYIRAGARITETPATFEVGAFVEKPDRETAETYIREGCYWNTGIFVWPAALMLEELRRHTPEIAPHFDRLDDGDVAGFFERVPSITIDVGLLERSRRVAVAAATFDWDDVGAWNAVARTRATDPAGNVAIGDVHLVDARDCIVWGEAGPIVVFGAEGMVIVQTGRVTLVATRERAPDLKSLLDRLPDHLRHPGAS